MKNEKIIYYKSFNEDVVENKNQNKKINSKFKWNHKNIIYKISSGILYIIAYVISFFYIKFILHVKIVNKNILKKYKKTGYFIYGNHSLTLGDVFNPAHVAKKRTYVLVSQANLGVPVIGKILPMLGAVVIPESISQMKEFFSTISLRIKQKKAVVIYPEGHLWPYYTKIRPFIEASFKYPVELNVPSFCLTTTYYKRKNKKRPGIKIYVDGPFFPKDKKKQNEKKKELCDEIYKTMTERSKNSNYEYIKYVKKQ